MGDKTKENAIKAALVQRNKDAWASIINEATPGSFNVSGNKVVWANKQGMYTPLRAYGATYLNPQGLDAAYNNAVGGLLDKIEDEDIK